MDRKKININFFKVIFCLFLFNISYANELDNIKGIQLESTRVIYYSDEKKGTTITITNNSDSVYLLQSRVLPWTENSRKDIETAVSYSDADSKLAPFIVLPPLVRMGINDKITLRIQLTENVLPKDRESIFLLTLKAIPSQSSDSLELENRIVLAVQNNLKLLYRPKGLPYLDDDSKADKLEFFLKGNKLIIKNPSPYYISLADIFVGDKLLSSKEGNMLSPFSSNEYELNNSIGNEITWRIINDKGLKSHVYNKFLSVIK